MSTASPARRFRLDRFERVATKASVLLRLSGSFADPDAHWIAQTGVLVVRPEGSEAVQLIPLAGSSIATSSDEGVHWTAAFGVRKSLLETGSPTRFEISAEGLEPIALPEPTARTPRTVTPAPPPKPKRAPAEEPKRPTRRPRRRGSPGIALRTAITDRIRIPLLAALAAGVAAVAGLALAPTRYSATTLLGVTPLDSRNPAFAGLPVVQSHKNPKTTVATARGLIGSLDIAQLTARSMGPGWTATRVATAVKVSAKSNTDLLQVTATLDAPRQATKLANAYAAAALAERAAQAQPAIRAGLSQARAELRAVGSARTTPGIAAEQRVTALEELVGHGDPTIQLESPARLAGRPGVKHEALIVLLALASGGLLGACAWWFTARFGQRGVQTERRVTDLAGVPILARLPVLGLVRRPAAPPPLIAQELQGALTLLTMSDQRPRTIALVSPSPGDGRTTAAIALAAHRAAKGQPVALLDFDWRKQDAARRLGVSSARLQEKNGRGWAAVFSTAAAVPTLVVGAIKVPLEPNDARANIDRALAMADLVVVDTPALSVTSDGLAAAAAAEVVLLVVCLEQTSESALAETCDALRRSGVTPTGVLLFRRRAAPREQPHDSRRADRAPSRRLQAGTR